MYLLPKIIKEEAKQKNDKVFQFRIKDALGKMKIEEDKYIVLKGSTAVIENRPSASESIIKMRNILESKGIIKRNLNNNLYIFQEDYIFNSPSFAASAISGGNENGRRQWKYKDMNLNQIEEMEINIIK